MSHRPDLKVMGPEGFDTPGDMLDAPVLTSKTDKHTHRRNVQMWYDCVQSSADFGYMKAKGVAGNLVHALFTKMETRYKTMVTAAVDGGNLRLRTHTDGSKFKDGDHVRCLHKILDIVAKESITDRVGRLIRMNRQVNNCIRQDKETYPELGDRFESHARAYLTHVGSEPGCQQEQNYAMVLLENAKLPISTYNDIINNRISHAKDNKQEPTTVISISSLTSIVSAANAQQALIESFNDHTSNETYSANTEELLKTSADLTSKLKLLKLPNPSDVCGSQAYTISLAKALEELRDIKTEEQRTGSSSQDAESKQLGTNTNDEKNKHVGSMITSNRSEPRHENLLRRRRPNRFKNHHGRPSGHRRNGSPHPKRTEKYYDRDTEDHDATSDDEEDTSRKRKPVFDRIGYRNNPYNSKKLRFDTDTKSASHDIDDDTDPYFRKPDRRRSYTI